MSKPVLIVIDVQLGAFDGEKMAPLSDAQIFLENVEILQIYFREQGYPVIFIQDSGCPGGAFESGTSHWEIHPKVAPSSTEKVFHKQSSSGFEGTNINNYLKGLGVENLVLCGLHSEHCFTNTAISALGHDYNVIIASDAHSTKINQNQNQNQNPKNIVTKQNKILQENGGVVLPTQEVLKLNFETLLETERLLVRQFENKDFEPLFSLMSDADSMKFTGFKVPQSKDQVRSALRGWKKEGLQSQGIWGVVVRDSQEFVGWVMLKPTTSMIPELGYMVLNSQSEKGYATEIAFAMLNYAEESLRIFQVVAFTSPSNLTSARVLEKIGMKKLENEALKYETVCYNISFDFKNY
ncbi:MAG: isochorismatase family protein [Bdellovibrionales bacterium]